MEVLTPPLGRNDAELLRQIKAYQHHRATGEVIPAGWQPGKATLKSSPHLDKNKPSLCCGTARACLHRLNAISRFARHTSQYLVFSGATLVRRHRLDPRSLVYRPDL